MELEDLYDLIDEALIVDQVNDYELGKIVRGWYWKYKNGTGETDIDWEDLTEDEEWDEFMRDEYDD